MRAVSRSRLTPLAVPLTLLTLVAGCTSVPSGSASAVVTYLDESGTEQRVEVEVENAHCDTDSPRRLGTSQDEIVMLVGTEGDATVSVRLDDELSFLAKTTASASRDGLEVDGVVGTVVRSGISGTQTLVSSDATVSGKVVCPES